MPHDNVIETCALDKFFGPVRALAEVTVSVRRGEFVACMGASGSGKTTLMNILTCLDTPSGGRVFLDGQDLSALDEDGRRTLRATKIGMVFQQFHIIPYLNALENVMLAQYYHSVTDESAARKILADVGLANRLTHLPAALSGGEQQRVCIARALVNEPPLLFADEPTGNLDEENEIIVLGLLQDLHRQGRTIVLVTHNPDLAAHADRVIRLHHGRVVE
ncbi:MAG: ABC transporter ATP-binding protein [Verrucomicrobiales bacterium]|jgi:putative ABC transport system ATP-binding protein|nr:ABC transporter ATP-binding protein [Verrucomicrobiales bacterium]